MPRLRKMTPLQLSPRFLACRGYYSGFFKSTNPFNILPTPWVVSIMHGIVAVVDRHKRMYIYPLSYLNVCASAH